MAEFHKHTKNTIPGAAETRSRPGAPFIPPPGVHLTRKAGAVAQPLARHHTDPLHDMIGRWSRERIPKWYPILDLIPEAEPVHFGGHALLRWAELAQKAVHWEENVRWVGWSFADKLELMWMCEDC